VRWTMAVVMDFKRNDLHVLVVDFHVVMMIQNVVAASLRKRATGKMIAMCVVKTTTEITTKK